MFISAFGTDTLETAKMQLLMLIYIQLSFPGLRSIAKLFATFANTTEDHHSHSTLTGTIYFQTARTSRRSINAVLSSIVEHFSFLVQ